MVRFPLSTSSADTTAPAGASPPLATLLLLANLQPVADQLCAGLPDLSPVEALRIEGLLATCGSAVIAQGEPAATAATAARLRQVGLTTSINLRS